MKIYTKTGDKGTSALWTGDRFPKNHHIFECLGSIDELNAYLGLISLILLISFFLNRHVSIVVILKN